jgi:SAM-dependent methyltransferase
MALTRSAPVRAHEPAPQAVAFPYVLVPGGHHLLTRELARELARVRAGAGEAPLYVWAVTSANHRGTRRNPIPVARRTAAIELFARQEGLHSVVVEVDDVAGDRLAEVVVKTVAVETGNHVLPTPLNTLVVAADRATGESYRTLGFHVATAPQGEAEPAEVLAQLATGDGGWRGRAHPATVDVYDRYRLAQHVLRVCNDRSLGAEGSLTATRNYAVYQAALESSAQRKWRTIRPFVRPGRVVDIGCGPGALLQQAAADPELAGCDLYGVEISRHLFQECLHKKARGAFANPNTYFLHGNILSEASFRPASVDTTVTCAVTHEIYSYGEGRDDIHRLAAAIAAHTAPGGAWINLDVCAPDEPDRVVDLVFHEGPTGVEPVDLTRRAPDAAGDYLAALRPADRFAQFAADFRRNTGAPFVYRAIDGGFRLRLADAMEFMTRYTYTDSWLSESHERFCALTWPDWLDIVRRAGLQPDPRSGAWRNEWLVSNVFDPVAEVRDPRGGAVPWPVTHLTMVAHRGGGPR